MTVFLCIQKPDSKYYDVGGYCYQYGLWLSNAKKIEEGDWLVLSLTNATSRDGRKVFGFGCIDEIEYSEDEGKEFASSIFGEYYELDPPLTYEELGGDPRANTQHAISRIREPAGEALLDLLMSRASPVTQEDESPLPRHVELAWSVNEHGPFVDWLDGKLRDGWELATVIPDISDRGLRTCVFRRS